MKPLPRWLLLVGTVLTGLTGIVYAWMKYLLTPETEWAVVNHPLQPWVLKAHILAAPILVFGLGAVFFDHILAHIRSGIAPGRRTGIAVTVVLLPMIATGYLIQSITHVEWLRAMVWGHLVSSAVYLIFYAAHARLMARRRAQRGAAVRLAPSRPGSRRGPVHLARESPKSSAPISSAGTRRPTMKSPNSP